MKYTDADRSEFIKKLDESGIDISEWETSFVGSNLDRTSFSEAQRTSIDRMIDKYGARIKF